MRIKSSQALKSASMFPLIWPTGASGVAGGLGGTGGCGVVGDAKSSDAALFLFALFLFPSLNLTLVTYFEFMLK